MSEWKPITVSELEQVIARQLQACTSAQQVAFASLRVPIYPTPLRRLGNVEPVLVIAELGDGLIYFEDVEEGFEIGVPGPDGVLPEASNMQYELCHLLHRAGL